MGKRKPISKKDRFEIFKRDGFQCAYCGKSPPLAVLEIDHIEPVSKGGSDESINLITSCFDCNRGKRDILLSSIPPLLSDQMELLKEKEEQLKEFRKLTAKVERRIKRDIELVAGVFQECFPTRELTAKFRNNSVRTFLAHLDIQFLQDKMRYCCGRFRNEPDRAVKYFCGICWKTIRGEAK